MRKQDAVLESVLMRLLQHALTERFGEPKDVARIAKDADDDNEEELIYDVDDQALGEAAGSPQERVHVSKPTRFEDGARSFWEVIVGIGPRANARQINSTLASVSGVIMMDKSFSAPMKRHGGLRINKAASDYDAKNDPSVGRALHARVTQSLTGAGFSVVPMSA